MDEPTGLPRPAPLPGPGAGSTAWIRYYTGALGWLLACDLCKPAAEQGRTGEGAVAHAGSVLFARCDAFDAVSVPRGIGSGLMLRAEASAVPAPPCVLGRTSATVLVKAGTGAGLVGLAGMAGGRGFGLRSGSGQWIAVPPAGGLTWDTPPRTGGPGASGHLPAGQSLAPALLQALRAYADGAGPR